MKSRLFSQFDALAENNKQFRRDLAQVLSLSTEHLKVMIKALPDVLLSRTKRQ